MHEEWSSVPGYEGSYEVSNMGRVRSLDRMVRANRNFQRLARGQMLRPVLKKETGYTQVLLGGDGWLVHRLVAKLFCPGEADGLVVDHINCNRADNRAENLRWVTHTMNISRPYRESGLRGNALGKTGAASTKPTAIVATHVESGQVRQFACAMDAVREMGFDSGAISNCCHKRQKTHKGWVFVFADGVVGFRHRVNRSVASLGGEE